MAITVNVQPDGTAGITPAHNDIIFIVTSSNYAQTNFKFIAVVKDGSGNQIAKLKAPIQYGSTDKAVFNLRRILQSYVSHNIGLSVDTTARCTDSYADYSVEFGEEYRSTPTEYMALTTVSGQTVWNAAFDAHDWISYAFSDWIMTGSSKKFLTNLRRKAVTSTQKDFLYFWSKAYSGSPAPVAYLRVTGYNAAGSVLVQFDIPNSYTATAANNRLLRVVSGPAQLDIMTTFAPYSVNIITAGSGTPGTNLLTGNTSLAYYTIQPLNSTPTAIGEAYRFDLRTDCSKFDPVQLFWLNRLGGFDSWVFNGKSSKRQDSERRTFRKNPNEYATTPSYGYSHASRGSTEYVSRYTRTRTLNSGWLTDAEAEAFAELFTSPHVLMIDADGHLLAVNVKGSSYEVRKAVNDKVVSISVDIEESVGSYSQNA